MYKNTEEAGKNFPQRSSLLPYRNPILNPSEFSTAELVLREDACNRNPALPTFIS